MFRFIKIVTALGICVASLLGHVETSGAQQNPVTAVDIALEPDQTMIQHSQADNASVSSISWKRLSLPFLRAAANGTYLGSARKLLTACVDGN